MRSFLAIFWMNAEEIIQFTIYLGTLLVLVHLTYRSLKPAYADRCGWYWVRPALMHHFALVGSAAFSFLMWWVYLFVGSARTDAASQEKAMLLLAVAFGLGAFAVWWLHYAHTVSWKDDMIRVGRLRKYQYFDLNDVVDIFEVRWRSQWCIKFADGNCVYVSGTAHGFDDLGEHLDQVLP